MNVLRGNTKKSTATIVPLIAATMLLSACTTLVPGKEAPTPSQTASATPQSSSPVAEEPDWESCTNPVITVGAERVEGWKYVVARKQTIIAGSKTTEHLLDEPFSPSVSWDAGGPKTKQFAKEIEEATGQSIGGAVSGEKQVNELLDQMTDKGVTVAYKTVEEIRVPLGISCGSTLSSQGTLSTTRASGTGILDCALPTDSDKAVGSPTDAKKKFCSQD